MQDYVDGAIAWACGIGAILCDSSGEPASGDDFGDMFGHDDPGPTRSTPEALDAKARGAIDEEIARLGSECSGWGWNSAGSDLVCNDHNDEKVESLRRVLNTEGATILSFAPDLDGQGGKLVLAFGSVATADHLGVFVTGTGGTVYKKNWVGDARRLHSVATDASAGEVATIAYLGYDAPNDFFAASQEEYGEAASGDLVDLLETWGADKHVTLVGHSYGSYAAAIAASKTNVVDDLVFTGSPGTSFDHASEIGVRNVWVAEHPGDMVADIARDFGWATEYGGVDPGSDRFGAYQIEVDGGSCSDSWGVPLGVERQACHGKYYHDRGASAIDGIGRVVAGDYLGVELRNEYPDCSSIGPNATRCPAPQWP